MATKRQKLNDEQKAEWHASREAHQRQIDEHAERIAGLYSQRERIVAYLPRLYEQREATANRLAELDDLIADEERDVEELWREVS